MSIPPPSRFIAAPMEFAMVTTAERNSEFIADLAAQCRRLGKAQMMRISRASAADKARLLGHRLHMLAVANASMCWQNQSAFVHASGSAPLVTAVRVARRYFGLV